MYIILTIPSKERGAIPLHYVTIRGRLARERIISLSHLSRLSRLVHDWPTPPAHIRQIYPRRSEGEILHALNPPFLCCGHHHTPARWTIRQVQETSEQPQNNQ